MEAKDIVFKECERQAKFGYLAKFGYEPSWEDFVVAGQEAGRREVVEWLKDEARTGYRYTNDDTHTISWEYDTNCDNEMMIDLGDLQVQLKSWGIKNE